MVICHIIPFPLALCYSMQVDDRGCIDLSGLLRVRAGYGRNGISLLQVTLFFPCFMFKLDGFKFTGKQRNNEMGAQGWFSCLTIYIINRQFYNIFSCIFL